MNETPRDMSSWSEGQNAMLNRKAAIQTVRVQYVLVVSVIKQK